MFYLPPFQSAFDDVLLIQHYIARGGTNMNYAKKSGHFFYHTYFFIRKT